MSERKKPIWIYMNKHNRRIRPIYSRRQLDGLLHDCWVAKLRLAEDYNVVGYAEALEAWPKEMQEQFGYVRVKQ